MSSQYWKTKKFNRAAGRHRPDRTKVHPVTIYGIYDYEGRCRYVGQTTKSPDERFQQHMESAVGGSRTRFHKWLKREVVSTNRNIEVRVLESSARWDIDEALWIKRLTEDGHALFNMTDGAWHHPNMTKGEEKEYNDWIELGAKTKQKPNPQMTFYGLFENGVCRYVGQTSVSLSRQLFQIKKQARSGNNSYLHEWLRTCPNPKAIEIRPIEANSLEEIIENFRSRDVELLNR